MEWREACKKSSRGVAERVYKGHVIHRWLDGVAYVYLKYGDFKRRRRAMPYEIEDFDDWLPHQPRGT